MKPRIEVIMDKRYYRNDKSFRTSGDWIEGNTISIIRNSIKRKRKVRFNNKDGLYITIMNMKYFEYEFEPC